MLRSANEADAPEQTPALPATLVAPDPSRAADHRRTLIAAEKAFSDRAQTVGIKQSFQEYGRPDAIHLFGPTGFAIGLPAIGANHDQQPAGPATSHWSADTAVVASSGDLGVTIGAIRSNGPPPEGQPAEISVLHDLAPRQPESAVAVYRRVADWATARGCALHRAVT